MAKLISLYGMIETIEEHDPQVFNRIFLPEERNSRAYELFCLLREQPYLPEDVVYSSFYSSTQSKASFLKLKKKLFETLSGGMCLIRWDKQNYSKTRTSYYNNLKHFAATNILIFKGKRHSARPILEGLFREGKKYNDILFLPFILRHLLIHYGAWERNPKKFEDYFKDFTQINKEYKIFQKYSILLSVIVSESKQNTFPKTLIDENIKTELLNAFNEIHKFKSPHLISTICYSLGYLMIMDKNFEFAKRIFQKGIDLIKTSTKEGQFHPMLQSLLILQSSLSIHLKHYAPLKVLIQTSKNKFPDRQLQFLSKQSILAFLHQRKYNEAYAWYNGIISNPKLDYPKENGITERFHLFHSYFALLIKVGILEQAPNHPPFRLGKFLNQVPEFSKDKKGMNISILIIQTLILLADRKYDAFLDRLECLRVYKYKHLAKDHDLFRASTFIKMLQLIPKAQYDRERLEWRGSRYLEKMDIPREELPITATDLEIIPFEDLWNIVLDMMDTRRGKLRPSTSR